jgi:phage/plasmid-like protein (TIGR03299 family)
MSHEWTDGFSVREGSWHGLATVLADYPGREEAMAAAGHNFTIIEKPVSVDGVPTLKFKGLVRDDNSKLIYIAKDSYGIVQPSVLWDIADALFKADSAVKYETAGVLRDSLVMWVLVKLDEPVRISGDDSAIFPYGCVSTTHDGSGSTRADTRSIRTICMNTYAAGLAESDAAGTVYTFRHTKNVEARIEDAKLAIKGIRANHEAFVELAEDLGKVKLTPSQRNLFIENFIPMPTASADVVLTKRVLNNIDTARGIVRGMFNGETVADAHKYTGYGALCAAVEYLDHGRAYRTPDSYFARSVMRVEPAKTGIVKLIRECARA